MANQPTINNGIETIVDQKIAEIPIPMKVTITKVYDDNKHVDVKTSNEDTLEYLLAIGNNLAANHTGILLVVDNNEMIIITR